MKANEIRLLNSDERQTKLDEFRKKVLFLRLQKGIYESGNSVKIRQVKRDIARILTIKK